MAQVTPRLIGRGDLLAALDRAAARKVTIISAPAGSGKTSLLRTWADHPGQLHRLADVQVQRDQHDDQQFWLALISAVRQAFGTTCNTEPASSDTRLQCTGDGRPGAIGARRCSWPAFPALTPRWHGADTVLTGLLDQSALYGVLAETEALGLDLLEIRQLEPHRKSPESGNRCSP